MVAACRTRDVGFSLRENYDFLHDSGTRFPEKSRLARSRSARTAPYKERRELPKREGNNVPSFKRDCSV